MKPAATNLPHLMVVQRRAWFLRRNYRLFVLPQELVGVSAAATADGRRDELETKPFEQLRDDHRDNFTPGVQEIESAQLTAPALSRDQVKFSTFDQAGLLRLKSTSGKTRTLAFCTSYDAQVARSRLPAVLGSKLSIEVQKPTAQASFVYGGTTVLFYDPAHGNQVEFLDSDGRCYLWYPGNSVVVPGRWRVDGDIISFRYGRNTYNPVAGLRGGGWEPTPIEFWESSIVDAQPGDICGLATGKIPYRLFGHPAFRSVHDARRGWAEGDGG